MMRRDPLMLWLVGAMFVVILTLGGIISASYSERMNRVEGKIDAIHREYGRIAVLESLAKESKENQMLLRQQLDEIHRELLKR